MAAAHHTAQPTCRLGIAAYALTSGSEPSDSTVPMMWCTTRVSTIPGVARRGGATAQAQNTANEAVLAPTSAERQRPYALRRKNHSHRRTDGVTR
jgi:hypothetical protein